MRGRDERRALQQRLHLDPHLVVASEREQRLSEQHPHVDVVGPREEEPTARTNGVLILALGDELLGARGSVLGVRSHEGDTLPSSRLASRAIFAGWDVFFA